MGITYNWVLDQMGWFSKGRCKSPPQDYFEVKSTAKSKEFLFHFKNFSQKGYSCSFFPLQTAKKNQIPTVLCECKKATADVRHLRGKKVTRRNQLGGKLIAFHYCNRMEMCSKEKQRGFSFPSCKFSRGLLSHLNVAKASRSSESIGDAAPKFLQR